MLLYKFFLFLFIFLFFYNFLSRHITNNGESKFDRFKPIIRGIKRYN